MELSAGVLIIGSLYWENTPVRAAWREERLQVGSYLATAPIRYGRRAQKRGNTYTMVFDRECALGQARVVGFKMPVKTIADLILEAEHLWTAERDKSPNGRLSASWGCIGLLARPEAQIPVELLNAWGDRVASEEGYAVIARDLAPLVNEDGLFQLPWPLIEENEPVPLDLLFATATKPTLTGNPPRFASAEEIADAWGEDADGNVRYLRNNRGSGIYTFQDPAIIERLQARHPAAKSGLA